MYPKARNPITASKRRTPTLAPTAIPAIVPFDSPFLEAGWVEAADVEDSGAVFVEDKGEVEVAVD